MNKFLRNIKYKLKKWSRIPKCTLLCIRFPFLYPRNRFSGFHYHAFWLEHLITDYKRKSMLSFSINVEGDENEVPSENIQVTDNLTLPEYKTLSVIEIDNTFLRVYIKTNSSILQVENVVNHKILYTLDLSKFLLELPTVEELKKEPNYYKNKFIVYWKQKKNFIGSIIATQLIIHYNDKKYALHNTLPFSECYPSIIINPLKNNIKKILEWFNKVILQNIMICTSYTELDAMPYGWRKTFGIQMCKDIKKALIKELGYKGLFNYRICQIKEKYGSLRWYDCGGTQTINDIIDKYERLSFITCINCGKPATKVSQGWISSYCDDCIGDRVYSPIEKAYPWYNFIPDKIKE
jgi:hypothetical protein